MNEFLVTMTARHRDDGSVFITCSEIPFVNVVADCEAKAVDLAFDVLRETLQINYGCSVLSIRPVGEAADLIQGCRQSKAMPSHVIAQIAA